MQGYGKLIYFASKNFYQGEFHNGLPHGKGQWIDVFQLSFTWTTGHFRQRKNLNKALRRQFQTKSAPDFEIFANDGKFVNSDMNEVQKLPGFTLFQQKWNGFIEKKLPGLCDRFYCGKKFTEQGQEMTCGPPSSQDASKTAQKTKIVYCDSCQKFNLEFNQKVKSLTKTKSGTWLSGSMIPQNLIPEAKRQESLKLWSKRQDELILKGKEIEQQKREAEKAFDAKVQRERNDWDQKREKERVNEKPFINVDPIQLMLNIKDQVDFGGIYPFEKLKNIKEGDEKQKNLQIILDEIIKTNQNLRIYDDKTSKYGSLDTKDEKNIKLAQRRRILREHWDEYENSKNDSKKNSQEDKDSKIQDYIKDHMSANLSSEQRKKLSIPDIPEKSGYFWNPYYFPSERKHYWIRENVLGMRYASFDKIEQYIYPSETGSQTKERRDKEDDGRAIGIIFRFFLYIMTFNILSYYVYHGAVGLINPQTQIEQQEYDAVEIEQLCKGETLIDQLQHDQIHSMKILKSSENGTRKIKIDDKIIGTKVCIQADEGRGVIFKSHESDFFNQTQKGMFTVTKKNRTEQWFTTDNTHDTGATEARPFFVNWILEDKEFEMYGNREVNLGSKILTDRGSRFIIIDTEKMEFTNEEELSFTFAKDFFYMSDFFIYLFSYTLLFWVVYAAFATYKANKKFGKKQKAPLSVQSLMALTLYTYDFVKDYQLLITQKHSFTFIVLYSFTIASAIVYNIYDSRIIQFSLRERGLPVKKERTPGYYTNWRNKTDNGQPIEKINEIFLFFRSFKSQMGFNFDTGDLDQAQKRYQAEAVLKLYENIPQIMLVLFESFVEGKTIMFVQLFNPTFGLIMAIATFSAQTGFFFKADFDYIYHNEFTSTTSKQLELQALEEKDFHSILMRVIEDTTKGQTSEEWQSASRLNSGTMLLFNAFNLQKNQDDAIHKYLFGGRKYTSNEKSVRALRYILQSQGLLLILFIFLFKMNLRPEKDASVLIDNGLVTDPAQIKDLVFQTFRNYYRVILITLLLTPFVLHRLLIQAIKAKNKKMSNQDKKTKNYKSQLTEPLLDKESKENVNVEIEDKKPIKICNRCGYNLIHIDDCDKETQLEMSYSYCTVGQKPGYSEEEEGGQMIESYDDWEQCDERPVLQCQNFHNCQTRLCQNCISNTKYLLQPNEVIETTADSIRIKMSMRAEFTFRGMLKIQKNCQFITIQANWFGRSDMLGYFGHDSTQLYVQLRKVVTDSKEKSNERNIREDDVDSSSSSSSEKDLDTEGLNEFEIQKKQYESQGPKQIQYLQDGHQKIKVITQEVFGIFDSSLNQTDIILGPESIIVQEMEPGDIIQLSQKIKGDQLKQFKKTNELIDVSESDNFFLSLELKLVGQKGDITPLYRYKCPNNKNHAVRAFSQRIYKGKFIDNPQFSQLMREQEEQNRVCAKCNIQLSEKVSILNIEPKRNYEQKRIQTKYFCIECKQPFCELCVFKHREYVPQPKRDPKEQIIDKLFTPSVFVPRAPFKLKRNSAQKKQKKKKKKVRKVDAMRQITCEDELQKAQEELDQISNQIYSTNFPLKELKQELESRHKQFEDQFRERGRYSMEKEFEDNFNLLTEIMLIILSDKEQFQGIDGYLRLISAPQIAELRMKECGRVPLADWRLLIAIPMLQEFKTWDHIIDRDIRAKYINLDPNEYTIIGESQIEETKSGIQIEETKKVDLRSVGIFKKHKIDKWVKQVVQFNILSYKIKHYEQQQQGLFSSQLNFTKPVIMHQIEGESTVAEGSVVFKDQQRKSQLEIKSSKIYTKEIEQ